jgi:transcriptional regulator with XRE-family HTH domain
MIGSQQRSFGQVIRERRRQRSFTQADVARRIKTSIPYVGHLESGKRSPSAKIVARLAQVLGLDGRELFLLANPRTRELLGSEPTRTSSAWDNFRHNRQLQGVHNIRDTEMEMLSRVALIGEVRSDRDFIFILNTVRHAVGRS